MVQVLSENLVLQTVEGFFWRQAIIIVRQRHESGNTNN